MRVAVIFSLLVTVLLSPAWAQHGEGNRRVGAPFATRSPVLAQNGLVATSQPLATQAALDILQQGGNAVDAAVAANAMLGLVEPVNSGIGGDLFAMVWDPKTQALYGINASGRSPQALDYSELENELERLGEDQIPLWGSLPVTVPGTVDGWFELHERFGLLSMEDILAPAIHYGREGFPVTQVIAHDWQRNADRFLENRTLIPELENFRSTFTINGEVPEEGDVFRNPDLAHTLEEIATGGRSVFYNGFVADKIDEYMRRVGGYLRKEDLAAHTSAWVEPISTSYRGYRVYELPPNTQGLAALQMLNILEGYDLARMGHNTADYLHVHAEAKKLAFADRARFFADPDFADIPIEHLLSKEYADRQREQIDMDKAQLQVESAPSRLDHGDTVYLTVADSTGMMVSLIQSNYWEMGSGLVPDGLGFMLQDRGALFSMEEGHPNVYEPSKRPFHTIIPAFVTRDGQPFMSFGVMGGGMQPQGHVQVLCNIIDFEMNVQEAGDAPRYHHTNSSQPTGERMLDGGLLQLENGISNDVVEDLRRRGHTISLGAGYFGGYQGIMWDIGDRVYHGASEMRKDGQAAGY